MLLSLAPERQHGVLGPGTALLPAGHVHRPAEAHPEALRQTAGLLQPSWALLFQPSWALLFLLLLLLLVFHHHRFSFWRHVRTCQEGLRSSQRHACGGVAAVQRGGLYDPDQLRGKYRDSAAQTDGTNPRQLAVHSSAAGEQLTRQNCRTSVNLAALTVKTKRFILSRRRCRTPPRCRTASWRSSTIWHLSKITHRS